MPLTGKESKFCREYLVDYNGTRAAIAAGYSKKTAREIAYENLTKPHIKEELRLLQTELMKSAGLTAEMVVNELKALAYWNIQDFIDQDNAIKDLTTLPLGTTIPVSGIKSTVKSYFDALGHLVKEVTTEIKLTEKRGSLGDLGRHLGVFEKDNNQKGAVIKVTRK